MKRARTTISSSTSSIGATDVDTILSLKRQNVQKKCRPTFSDDPLLSILSFVERCEQIKTHDDVIRVCEHVSPHMLRRVLLTQCKNTEWQTVLNSQSGDDDVVTTKKKKKENQKQQTPVIIDHNNLPLALWCHTATWLDRKAMCTLALVSHGSLCLVRKPKSWQVVRYKEAEELSHTLCPSIFQKVATLTIEKCPHNALEEIFKKVSSSGTSNGNRRIQHLVVESNGDCIWTYRLVEKLVAVFPQLRTFRIRNTSLSTRALQTLFNRCPLLAVFSQDELQIHPPKFETTVVQCPTSLSVFQDTFSNSGYTLYFPLLCEQLETLDLYRGGLLPPHHPSTWLSHLPQLKTLRYRPMNDGLRDVVHHDSEWYHQVALHPSLTHLELDELPSELLWKKKKSKSQEVILEKTTTTTTQLRSLWLHNVTPQSNFSKKKGAAMILLLLLLFTRLLK